MAWGDAFLPRPKGMAWLKSRTSQKGLGEDEFVAEGASPGAG